MTQHLFLSRSAIEAYQRCPREWYLTYRYLGTGITSDRTNSDLALGIARHKGVETILNGGSLDDAIAAALKEYDRDTNNGLEGTDSAYLNDMRREHKAIIEAGLRVWYKIRLPQILGAYDILVAEKEISLTLPGGSTFEIRPDAVLKSKFDGKLYPYSLKNPRQYNSARHPECNIDIQGRSETWGVGLEYGEALIGGVIMDYIMTGKEDEDQWTDKEDSEGFVHSMKIRWTPLVRGWYRDMPDMMGREYAWRFKYDNPMYNPAMPQNNYHNPKQKSFKGGQRVAAWEYEGGVKQWVEDLLGGSFMPGLNGLLDELVYSPDPYYRQPEQIQEFQMMLYRTEDEILTNLEKTDKAVAAGANAALTLAYTFPQHNTSCVNKFGKRCPMWNFCHKGANVDPLNNGYKQREPHHQKEREALNARNA